MKTTYCLTGMLLLAFTCPTNPVHAAPSLVCADPVSISTILKSPEKYHGRKIWTMAFITTDFENMTACPSEKSNQNKICLWINANDGSYNSESDYPRYEKMLQKWKKYNRQTIAIHATFSRDEKGHFSMWPGGLINITEISSKNEGWSFAKDNTFTYKCPPEKTD